jgi:hypothetical protein
MLLDAAAVDVAAGADVETDAVLSTETGVTDGVPAAVVVSFW